MDNYYDSDICPAHYAKGYKLYLTLFWSGFFIYTIGYSLTQLDAPIYILCDLMRLIGIVMILYSIISLVGFEDLNSYLKVLFTIYMFWQFLVVFRGFKLEYQFIKNILFIPYGGVFLYFAPFVLLFRRTPHLFSELTKLIIAFGVIYLLLLLISYTKFLDPGSAEARNVFEIFYKTLGISCGILLMVSSYLSKAQKVIVFLVMIVSTLLSIYLARRGLMFMSILIWFFSILTYVYSKKKQILIVLFFGLISIILLLLFYNTSKTIDSKLFERAKERIDEDTRSGVEDYYYADMQGMDWVIGRGMSGMVAAPIGIDSEDDMTGLREGIETDYLNIILKGGIIGLGLQLLIALPAMFLALFFSRNILSKAAGYWILLWLVSLYPSNVTNFTISYILVWIAIGVGYSKRIRHLPDGLLRKYLIRK